MHIKVPIECTQAAVSALPGSMLTGETTRISMEVFNVGQM